MFKNLEKEILKNGITLEEISKELNIPSDLVRKKINGTKQFTLKETILLRNIIDKSLSYDYLFKQV